MSGSALGGVFTVRILDIFSIEKSFMTKFWEKQEAQRIKKLRKMTIIYDIAAALVEGEGEVMWFSSTYSIPHSCMPALAKVPA